MKNSISDPAYTMRPLFLVLFLFPFVGGGETLRARADDARYLNFSARDPNRVYLRDLKIGEISLFLDGKPVPVLYLGYKNVETAFVFLIENSPRTAPHMVSMPQWGRINVLDQIRYQLLEGFFPTVVESGPVLIAEFYREVHVLQDFTDQDFLLEEALRKMIPNFARIEREEIPVARALGRGVDLLRQRPERRKIVVLFTTTVDRESYRNLEEYRQLLRGAEVEVYVVSFAPRFASGPGYSFEEKMNGYFFRNLVEETSGRFYLAGEYAYVWEFMDDLMSSLANTYTIGFYVEPGEEPRPHAVELKVRNDKVEVWHRPKLIY